MENITISSSAKDQFWWQQVTDRPNLLCSVNDNEPLITNINMGDAPIDFEFQKRFLSSVLALLIIIPCISLNEITKSKE